MNTLPWSNQPVANLSHSSLLTLFTRLPMSIFLLSACEILSLLQGFCPVLFISLPQSAQPSGPLWPLNTQALNVHTLTGLQVYMVSLHFLAHFRTWTQDCLIVTCTTGWCSDWPNCLEYSFYNIMKVEQRFFSEALPLPEPVFSGDLSPLNRVLTHI